MWQRAKCRKLILRLADMKRFLASLICLLLLSIAVQAEETIISFKSDVTVNSNSTLDVVEAIAVISDGSTIRHGIFRDFPTRYTDKNGIQMRVDFSVESVSRNGEPENYVVESISGGKRIKIGDKDILIEPGIHKYIITYHTDRQLGFFKDYDELYWNVTGNGWQYAIQNASVTIHLPSGAKISNPSVYTGVVGSSGSDAQITLGSGNQFAATTTRVLDHGEGLTVAIAWQKGIVAPPSAQQQQLWMLRDNAGYAGLVATLLAVAAFFFWAWNKVGRDPPSGTIIPLFRPPESLGPAGVRFLWKQKFDDRAMAASLVGLAVQGRLKIENNNGDYIVTKLENKTQALSPSEELIYNALPQSSLALEKTNNATIRALNTKLEKHLDAQYRGSMFVKNLGWFSIGLLVSIIGLAISAFLAPDGLGFAGLFVGGFAAVIWCIILVMGWASVKGLISNQGIFGKLKSIAALIFMVPFVGAAIAVPVAFAMTEEISPMLVAFIGTTVAIGLINLLFSYLMPAPTVAGRRVLDTIEGFRLYMTTAEEKRLDMLTPPEKTPELFERYLPYAMALDCENAWNAKFASVLAAAAAAGAAGAAWYYGSGRRNNDWGSMTHDLGSSLASTISSSSVAPGSSSGSGGGGSSGGGGGGGGGGGW